ncbi:hypothetical protein KQI84_11540 [bacterium]|nr:hypothetical protein [bacterium]
MAKRQPPSDLKRVQILSIKDRPSKVRPELLGSVPPAGATMAEFLATLPNILKAADLLAVARALADAHRRGRAIVWMMGAHPIKCGLSPILTEMIRRGWITTLCLNGAGGIHDFELANFGHTSEDVETGLADGSFGMVRETAEGIFGALRAGKADGVGAGEAIGRAIAKSDAPHGELSLLQACYEAKIPATLHIGIGTDIIHQQPSADGALMGEMSMRDFRLLAGQLSELDDGGVVVNLGSAVLLPEVFLKALTVARNLGARIENFTAVNFDMIQHYRANTNVVARPTRTGGGRGYSLTGHHEIMIPLLFAAVQEELAKAE